VRGEDFVLVLIPRWYWTVRYDWLTRSRARRRGMALLGALLAAIST
jgi:hypothetical protein